MRCYFPINFITLAAAKLLHLPPLIFVLMIVTGVSGSRFPISKLNKKDIVFDFTA
jgi:hypothetical protein